MYFGEQQEGWCGWERVSKRQRLSIQVLLFFVMTLAFTVSEIGSPWKILSRGTTDVLWSLGDGMMVMEVVDGKGALRVSEGRRVVSWMSKNMMEVERSHDFRNPY